MPNPFVDKLGGYRSLDRVDQDSLTFACRDLRSYLPRHDLIREGDEPGAVIVIIEGWACRYKILPDGSRQIIAFMMPGDFCDMHVAVLAEMDHSIATLTSAKVAWIPADEMEILVEQRPNLVHAFWWAQLVDQGVLRATIVNMGRRTAVERVAHLLSELYVRMSNVGLLANRVCRIPLTQIVLADAVGLTAVHTNRVIKQLREVGAIKLPQGYIVVLDIARLVGIAGFDDNYLHRNIKHSA